MYISCWHVTDTGLKDSPTLFPGNASANSAPTTARRRNMATSEAHITSSCADSASEPPHCNTNQINLTKYFEVLQSIRFRCFLQTAITSGCPISVQPNLLRTMYKQKLMSVTFCWRFANKIFCFITVYRESGRGFPTFRSKLPPASSSILL
jgi:hypothetical protein